jgi:hypothetical protein
MKNYYVYVVEDYHTGEFYIGSRGFVGMPISDKYLGSPYTWRPNFKNLRKRILVENIKDMSSAISVEREYILQNIKNPLNRNYAVPNPNWNRDGKITAKTKEGKIITISTNDPLLGIEFFGVTKGMVLVKNKNGDVFYTSIEDEKYISGELVHNNTGLITGENHRNYGKR